MNIGKLLLEAIRYIGPPVARWIEGKLDPRDKVSKSVAESNRHATQSGAARDASSDATQKMMDERKRKQ